MKKKERLAIRKTYKNFVDGKFIRTESGRYYELKTTSEDFIANICQSSRKDFRDAVITARKGQSQWAERTAYNRGQILYRIAEIMETQQSKLIDELVLQGANERIEAEAEFKNAVDRTIYYAGWADKYCQLFSSVNPVSTSHFNFSVPEPSGVLSIIAPENNSLLGLISTIIPLIVSGNTVVVLASQSKPLCATSFAEILNNSDVPSGVVNILTGIRSELISHFSSHMDVNAMLYCGDDVKERKIIQENASQNLKRIIFKDLIDWTTADASSPYNIMDAVEIKTTWHPIGL